MSRSEAMSQAIVVRVIEYALPGLADAQPRYRLLTTMLDPEIAPALDLAAVYHQRWEIEGVFDELKTHLRQSRRVLRSKTAELVRQEFYGWVLAHYSVRWLLHQGATRHRIPHAELSFTGHVQLLRRAQPRSGAFPPARPRRRRRWFNELLEACARIRATRTLNKRSPRMLKRRHSPYVSYDRHAPTRVPMDCTPKIIGPPGTRPKPADSHIPRQFRSFMP
ncbi:transposase [Variovorax sp. LjRoot178]|uniref:transposase n=1 Tax=Variovorax sp. LjRoot178 TaxID=3342277 RepID=UPI003F519430